MRAHSISRLVTWSLAYLAVLSCSAPDQETRLNQKRSAQNLEPVAPGLDSSAPGLGPNAPLVFEFDAQGSPIRLVLRPTTAPTTKEYTSYVVDAHGQLSTVKHTAPSCFYETDIYDASTEKPLTGAFGSVSTCIKRAGYDKPTLYGLIYVHGKFWSITPIAGDSDLSDGITHQFAETAALKLGVVDEKAALVNVNQRFIKVPETAAFREGTPQETKYVEIFVAHDSSRLAAFNGDSEAMMNDGLAIMASVNTVFANSGLSPRLRSAVIGQISVPENAYDVTKVGQEVATEQMLNNFNRWSHLTLPPNDNHVLLSGYDFDGATIGLAPLGTMCAGELSGTVIQTKNLNASASQVIAHEIGHNLNMMHDSDTNACSVNGFLMSPVAGPGGLENPKFSSCSLNYYSDFMKNTWASCLDNMPTSIAADQCGDGVVSGAEQCDCGAADCTELDPCCQGATCTLTTGSECSDFNDLCCSSCKIAPKTHECRPARDACDSGEFCSGHDKACPGDRFLEAGKVCSLSSGGEGQCFAGSCTSREEQCQSLGNAFGEVFGAPSAACQPLDCGDARCSLGAQGGQCVSIQGAAVSDGVACGDGGQCQGSTCVPSANIDDCPLDELKTAPGICGCGVADLDTDADGVADCEDFCPNDIAKTEPGSCGCGNMEPNATGVTSCDDECPASIEKELPGACGCAVLDTDSDGDGTADCNDLCPANPSPLALPETGCVAPAASGGTDGAGTGGNGAGAAGPITGSGGTENGSQKAKRKDKKGCGCRIENHHEKEPPVGWSLFLGASGLMWLRRRARRHESLTQ